MESASRHTTLQGELKMKLSILTMIGSCISRFVHLIFCLVQCWAGLLCVHVSRFLEQRRPTKKSCFSKTAKLPAESCRGTDVPIEKAMNASRTKTTKIAPLFIEKSFFKKCSFDFIFHKEVKLFCLKAKTSAVDEALQKCWLIPTAIRCCPVGFVPRGRKAMQILSGCCMPHHNPIYTVQHLSSGHGTKSYRSLIHCHRNNSLWFITSPQCLYLIGPSP